MTNPVNKRIARVDVVEVYFDAASEWRWRYKATNGRIMADSGEGYNDRTAALEALNRVLGIDVRAKTSEAAYSDTVNAAQHGQRWLVPAGKFHRSVVVVEVR